MHSISLSVAFLFLFCGLAVAHPKAACRNDAFNHFMSMLEKGKKEMEPKKFACLDARLVDKNMWQAKNGIECLLIEGSKPILQMLLKNDSQEKSAMRDTWLDIQKCAVTYDPNNLLKEDGSLDFTNLAKSMSQPGEGDDAELVADIAKTCTQKIEDMNEVVSAELSMSAWMSCFFQGVIDECNSRGEDSGCMVTTGHRANSYYKENFSSLVLPPKVVDNFMTCLDETYAMTEKRMMKKMEEITGDWLMNSGSLKNEFEDMLSRMGPERLVGMAMVQMPAIQEEVWKFVSMSISHLTTCHFGKLNMINEEGLFDSQKWQKFLTEEVTGWSETDIELRDKWLEDTAMCAEISAGEYPMIDLQDDEEMYEAMQMWHQCMVPKFAFHIGMNNQLADFVDPFSNKKVLDKLISDFKIFIHMALETIKPIWDILSSMNRG